MDIDKFISTTVARQLPQFYAAEGDKFAAFIKAYFEWMEQNGYAISASRNLLTYNDIDTTISQFTDSFKNDFLVNFPATTAADKKLLVKKIKDFYNAKGSTQGMQLLFKLLFDDDIEVYDPGNDIIKASDGVWKIPSYIEVEHNDRARTFIGQKVYGSKTNASAFVESVHTTVVNGRIIDVLNISSADSNFEYGELITNDGNLTDAPQVTGSLTTINITDGGANNKIGDVFEIVASTNGKKGSAKVTAVTDGTGRVTFKLINGGSGYTTGNGQVFVSNTVLFTSNRSNSNGTTNYSTFQKICQPLNTVNYVVTTPANPSNTDLYHKIVTGYNGSTPVASGIVAVANSTGNSFVINITSGDFSQATSIKTPGNAVSVSGYSLTNTTATGIITGSNSSAVGVHNIINTFYANGAFLVSNTPTYSLTANVDSKSTGSGANFSIGSITDTEVVSLFTDLVGSNNVNYVPYMNLIISGSNSNTGLTLGTQSITTNTATNVVTGVGGTTFTTQLIPGSGVYAYPGNTFLGTVNNVVSDTSLNLANNALANVVTSAFYYNLNQYGFPKNVNGGYNTPIAMVLASNTFTIGTIASLSAINPGTDYNANPFVAVANLPIASFNRKNIILILDNKTGVFAVNNSITQTYDTPSLILGYNAKTGTISIGDGVTQSNGSVNAYATVQSTNSSTITITDISGAFNSNSAGGQSILSLNSGGYANVTSTTSSTLATIAKGTVVGFPDTNSIEIRRRTFNEAFQPGSTITSSAGGTATIVYSTQNINSAPMGFNANVSANVSTARGIATTLEIIESGYGHQPNDDLELVNNANPFAISGIANVIYQGKGAGYWVDNRGKLSSDKFIIDDYYYQDFSYEIQSRLSLDKYADILKKVAHVAGTKMFGRVLIGSSSVMPLRPIPSTISYN